MSTPHIVTVTLTEEEAAVVETLARERGIDEPADVLRALLHDAIEINDALWDKTFAETQDVLDRLADEAHEEYLAGLTQDFDPDTDPDAP
jgi:hypothetical protein